MSKRRRNPDGMDAACCRDRFAAVVVDRASARGSVRAGMDLPLFCGAQPAGDVWTSAMVVVGRSEDGGADAHRKNERGSAPLRRRKVENCKAHPGVARNFTMLRRSAYLNLI